jgi:hypothetical protein
MHHLATLNGIALAVGLLLGAVAATARADVPSAANSTAPSVIRLVGSLSGMPDKQFGEFLVVVRGLTNDVKNGATVVVDFSQCPDVVICADQMNPIATVNCGAKTTRVFTNSLGEARFTILGASTGASNAASVDSCVKIFGNGTLLRTARFATFDLDGSGGVGAGDLSVWLADFACGLPYERSDYDGDGHVGAWDLSEWLTVFGAGGSALSCGASCP